MSEQAKSAAPYTCPYTPSCSDRLLWEQAKSAEQQWICPEDLRADMEKKPGYVEIYLRAAFADGPDATRIALKDVGACIRLHAQKAVCWDACVANEWRVVEYSDHYKVLGAYEGEFGSGPSALDAVMDALGRQK